MDAYNTKSAEEELVELCKEAKAIMYGHFMLTSGRHSDTYINKDAIYSFPPAFAMVCSLMVSELKEVSYDVITGPAIAGAVLAAPVSLEAGGVFVYPEKTAVQEALERAHDIIRAALHTGGYQPFLTWKEEARAVLVRDKKPEGPMQFQRGYDKLIPGTRVVIVEDVITTGGSVQKTIDAVTKLGGKVVKVIVIWNRSGWEPEYYSIVSLINRKVESWLPSECPLCKKGLPLQDPKSL